MRNSTTRYVAVLLAAVLFCLGAYPGELSAQVPLTREPVPEALQRPAEGCIWEVPVVVIMYLPSRDRINIDVAKAPDYWNLGHMKLDRMRHRIQKIITATKSAREAGSRFRGYKNDQARPSIGIRVVALFTAYDLPPVSGKAKTIKGARVPFPDYIRILEQIDAKQFVENGVKEFWMWSTDVDPNFPAYKPDMHRPEYFRALWESNMAGPYGDVSNSDQDPDDLPVYSKTYTVYNFNIRRTETEATHNHIHQIERLLNRVDGRNRTPRHQWDQLLFWGKFVGSDASKKIVSPGCGWAHYPPNGRKDYDYKNTAYVYTDIEDWRPDGTGEKRRFNCERWECKELNWHLLWMQSLPGNHNRLDYNGRPLTNWWRFIGDFDGAMAAGQKLAQ